MTRCTRVDCLFQHSDDCHHKFKERCHITDCKLRHVIMNNEISQQFQAEPTSDGVVTKRRYNSSYTLLSDKYQGDGDIGLSAGNQMRSTDFSHCRGNYDPEVPMYRYPVKRLSTAQLSKNLGGRWIIPGNDTNVM